MSNRVAVERFDVKIEDPVTFLEWCYVNKEKVRGVNFVLSCPFYTGPVTAQVFIDLDHQEDPILGEFADIVVDHSEIPGWSEFDVEQKTDYLFGDYGNMLNGLGSPILTEEQMANIPA